MASSQVQRNSIGRANVVDRVASKVKDALRSDKAFEPERSRCQPASSWTFLSKPGVSSASDRESWCAASAAYSKPSATNHSPAGSRSSCRRPSPRRKARAWARSFHAKKANGCWMISLSPEGSRIGGAAAGATEISRDYGIPRSTLNHWHHAGDVIALLKGTKKHVYPVEQFIDGRLAKGIGTINALVGNSRVAWLWLSQANAALSGRKPIDVLKQDRVDEVIEIARAYFAA